MLQRVGVVVVAVVVPVVVVVGGAGCSNGPDVDALRQHMIEECNMTFGGPQESCADSQTADRFRDLSFDHAVGHRVRNADVEACILDVDCSDDLNDDRDVALLACLSSDGTGSLFPLCLQGCDDALRQCDPGCDESALQGCFWDHDTCRASCGSW